MLNWSEMLKNDSVKIIALVSFFTLYTFIVLWMSNFVLFHILPGYISVEDESLGLIIFFFAALGYAFYGRWKKWYDWKYYVLGAMTVYFPLVFIAASVIVVFNPQNAQLIHYTQEYCTVEQEVCGKAFAHMVYSISLRAMPTVLTAPALFWFLLFRGGKHVQESV